jgi:hypothetical protein
MGIFDSLRLKRGPAYKVPHVPIDGVIGMWHGAKTGGGLALAGGQVALTRDYLVFSPWDMDQTRAWLVRLLSMAGVPHAGSVNALLTMTRILEPVAIPVSGIARIQVLNWASTWNPPAVQIQLQDGSHFEVGILASPLSPSGSKANDVALNDWLSKMPVAAG